MVSPALLNSRLAHRTPVREGGALAGGLCAGGVSLFGDLKPRAVLVEPSSLLQAGGQGAAAECWAGFQLP